MSSTTTPSEPLAEGDPFLCPPQQQIVSKRAVGPLESSFQNEARDIVDQAIARCVCANGLSFNLVSSPYWRYVMRVVNEAPIGFIGPSYEKIHTTLLDDEVARVENAMLPIKDSWVETGVTIVLDGWKDARNRPLVNVIAVSTRGAMILRDVDCEGEVAETRFVSTVVRCLVKVKDTLTRMVTSANWSVWRQSNSAKAACIRGLILDESWWHRVEYPLKITKPILSMIRYADMDRPSLGEVYDGIDSMIEAIRNIINEKEQDPDEMFFKELQVIMVEKWNKMTTPLHLLAFALSPRFYCQSVLKGSTTRVASYKDT